MKYLLVIQGISESKNYLLEHAKDSGLFNQYNKIINIKTEDILDDSIYTIIPWFGDRFGDIIQYYEDTSKRIQLSRQVRKQIINNQEKGVVVDILAHSLGTVMALTSGPMSAKKPPIEVRNCMFIGCPLGIGYKIFGLRKYTQNHAKQYSRNFFCENMYYGWSSKDFISRGFDNELHSILDTVTRGNLYVKDFECKHSSTLYLENAKDFFPTA